MSAADAVSVEVVIASAPSSLAVVVGGGGGAPAAAVSGRGGSGDRQRRRCNDVGFGVGCPRFVDMRDACVLICCFFHLAGKISTHGISTCGHVRISAQNSHVVGLVQNIAWTCLFISEHFGNPRPF